MASRPNESSGKFTREDIQNKRTNLLFFGNFHAMKVEDYQWGMQQMMRDADYLYGSMIKDIYYLGKVLGRKYRYLRIAYSIFMYGFVVAILSFFLAYQLTAKGNFWSLLNETKYTDTKLDNYCGEYCNEDCHNPGVLF